MKDKTLPRSLKAGIAAIICLTIFVFSFLGISIHKMSENTIEEIGAAYMAGMNEQVSLHFEGPAFFVRRPVFFRRRN